MGFMASFWGSASQAQAEDEKDWKQLWQADEEREQRERHFRIQAEQADRDYQLRREQFSETVRQFNVQDALNNLQFDLDQKRVDQAYADSLMRNISPFFESADYVVKGMIVDQLEATAGNNQWLAPMIAGLRGAIPQSDLSMTDAWAVVAAWLDPTAEMNQFGFVPNISETDLKRALAVIEAGDPREYGFLLDEIEATRAARDEQVDFYNTEASESIRLRNLTARANIAQVEATTQGLIIDNKVNQATVDAQIQTIFDNAELSSLEVATRQTQLEFLSDQLSTDLELSRAQLKGLQNENELFETLMDTYVETAIQEARRLGLANDISESDLRVAIATETARIMGEDLKVEHLQASINQINSAIEHDAETRRMNKLRLGLDVIASGNTDMVEALWDDLFGDTIVDKETFLPLALEFTQGIEDHKQAVQAADLAHTLASTNQIIENTRLMPIETGIRQGHLQLGWAQLELQRSEAANRYMLEQMKLAGTPQTVQGALDTVDSMYGLNVADVRTKIESFEAGTDKLAVLVALGGDLDGLTAAEVASLPGLFEQFGIDVPLDGLGQPDLSYLPTLIEQAERELDRDKEQLESQMASLYYTAGALSDEPLPPIWEFFGSEFNPNFDPRDTSAPARQQLIYGAELRNPVNGYISALNAQDAAEFVDANPFLFDGLSPEDMLPKEAFRRAVLSFIPDPETLASIVQSGAYSALYDSIQQGAIGSLAGATPAEIQETLNDLGMGTLEDFKNWMWENNGYVEGHVENMSFIYDTIRVPMPEVDVQSLYSGEGQVNFAYALNNAGNQVDALRAAIDDGVLNRMDLRYEAWQAQEAVEYLSNLTSWSPQELVSMGILEQRPAPVGVLNSHWGDRLVPTANARQILDQYIDGERVKIMQGRAVLDELAAGRPPSMITGW